MKEIVKELCKKSERMFVRNVPMCCQSWQTGGWIVAGKGVKKEAQAHCESSFFKKEFVNEYLLVYNS